jgi:hypothetical protein
MSKEKKPFTIDDCAAITVPIMLRQTVKPGRDHNFLHMSFADTSATVLDKGKELGMVVCCLGGAIEVRIGKEEVWTLNPLDLFKAVRAKVQS